MEVCVCRVEATENYFRLPTIEMEGIDVVVSAFLSGLFDRFAPFRVVLNFPKEEK